MATDAKAGKPARPTSARKAGAPAAARANGGLSATDEQALEAILGSLNQRLVRASPVYAEPRPCPLLTPAGPRGWWAPARAAPAEPRAPHV